MSDYDLYQRAAAYLEQGNQAEAEKLAQKILDNNPDHANANLLLGIIASQRNQNGLASQFISRAIKNNPREPAYFFHLGVISQLDGRFNEALTAYDSAIHLDPNSARTHNNRGTVLKELGRPAGALAAYDHAIRIDPKFALAHNNRGSALLDLGREDEALEAFTHATEIDPHFYKAHDNRGILLTTRGLELNDKGSLEEALAAHGRAVEINPGFAEAHCRRGTILKWLVRLDEATEAYSAALQHNPALTEAKYFLAALGAAEAPAQSPQEYVIKEFDGFADNFDNKLQGELGYKVPQLLFKAVIAQVEDKTKKFNILDLGCGTGLIGLAFAEIANELIGVDLSPRMLEKAQELSLYTDLIQADVCQALEQCETDFDLILAADVFIYIGKLDEVFSKSIARLSGGGLFAFSVETKENGKDYELRLSGRYAQTIGYIQKLSRGYGFEEVSRNPITVRYEHGKPVAGQIFVLRAPF